ncbi:leucine dehydrogenase [Catalinimonas alkaloidigena]|uniref:Leucine dehydrogenase n=1 Tax=Catalinimonas alkaloidigena TaxID=1075417 RepID=A0A1G9EQG9_9BACT|nr:Glu/Leu/Phe/Val dehydrogenase [Catalinimonas alkaloidigena]SDK78281.1 leucine dehydrogenase [Catalinimonas alkaloidigena]
MVETKETGSVANSAAAATSLFGEIAKYEHEQVVFCYDPATGLKAIIGIHNTVLGPALGGTRMWNYATEAEAVRDVLRLSRGMTYKNAVAGLNHGGGKAVILGDPRQGKSEALLRRFGKFIQSLNGKYITAEDVGMSTRDIEYVAMETRWASGRPEGDGGSGDPSPVTAYGTWMGMKAAAAKAFGSDSLAGRRISVQGAGSVGSHLIGHLIKEGAIVFVTDLHEDRLEVVAQQHPITVVKPDEIYDLDVDIYAPCALGGTLNHDTLPRLKCRVVAGAANNQLENEDLHADACAERGILYAPDFLINAGGVVNVAMEFTGYNREKAYKHAEKIYDTTLRIFEKAEREGINTHQAAMRVAQERIQQMAQLNARL